MTTISDISYEIQRMVIQLIDQRIAEGETYEEGFWVYHLHFTELWVNEALSDPALDAALMPEIYDDPGAFDNFPALVARLRPMIVKEIGDAIFEKCTEVFHAYLETKWDTMPPPPEHESEWYDVVVDADRRRRVRDQGEKFDNHFQPRKW